MKVFATLSLAAISVVASFSALADAYKITRVIDGDTVEIAVGFLPAPLPPKLSIRVLGIDTPEKAPRAQCEAEAEKAKLASAFTKNAIATAAVIDVQIKSWDKYGGRVLGNVFLDGQSLAEMLINQGLARAYFGEAKSSWCN
jgi:endonuclease YncB( thermonuclease family)